MINLDVTFVIQLINFVVALVIVNYLLIRPVRAIIRERKTTRDGLAHQISSFVEQAGSDAANYEKTLRTAREEGGRLRQQAREQGLAKQADLLAAAGSDAAVLVRQERQRAADETEKAGAVLSAQVGQLADEVVRKLLA